MNKNGYILLDALLSLLIICVCASLLLTVLSVVHDKFGVYIDEEINKEWFYND